MGIALSHEQFNTLFQLMDIEKDSLANDNSHSSHNEEDNLLYFDEILLFIEPFVSWHVCCCDLCVLVVLGRALAARNQRAHARRWKECMSSLPSVNNNLTHPPSQRAGGHS